MQAHAYTKSELKLWSQPRRNRIPCSSHTETAISLCLAGQRAAESPENGLGARAMRLRRLRRARTSRLPTVRHVQSGSSTIRQASGRARDAPETSDRCLRSPAASYGSRSSAIVMPEAKALRDCDTRALPHAAPGSFHGRFY